MSLRDNQAISRQNSACVIVAPRQLSPRRDRQNGYPSCRCLPIQIVALHVEMAVILPPSPQDRAKHGREIGHALVVLQLDPPTPDCLPHRLEGVAADRR